MYQIYNGRIPSIAGALRVFETCFVAGPVDWSSRFRLDKSASTADCRRVPGSAAGLAAGRAAAAGSVPGALERPIFEDPKPDRLRDLLPILARGPRGRH